MAQTPEDPAMQCKPAPGRTTPALLPPGVPSETEAVSRMLQCAQHPQYMSEAVQGRRRLKRVQQCKPAPERDCLSLRACFGMHC